MHSPLFTIDYPKLREQKDTLIKVINNSSCDVEKNDLTGILHLIDGIQDYAVDILGMPVNEVFTL